MFTAAFSRSGIFLPSFGVSLTSLEFVKAKPVSQPARPPVHLFISSRRRFFSVPMSVCLVVIRVTVRLALSPLGDDEIPPTMAQTFVHACPTSRRCCRTHRIASASLRLDECHQHDHQALRAYSSWSCHTHDRVSQPHARLPKTIAQRCRERIESYTWYRHLADSAGEPTNRLLSQLSILLYLSFRLINPTHFLSLLFGVLLPKKMLVKLDHEHMPLVHVFQ